MCRTIENTLFIVGAQDNVKELDHIKLYLLPIYHNRG